ncbi:MAG: CRTAC1 family protein, partial [Planctomycetota bacterium]|nr:CRTAC1 family protein [Planctomycetota bacterium]
ATFTRPVFVDRAVQLGVEYRLFRDRVVDRYYFPEVMGSGIAWVDLDLDGYLDLYLANGDSLSGTSSHLNQVYRNCDGNRFENVTSFVSKDGKGFSQGLSVGDLNRDGFDDVFVTNFGQNYWLLNQGDGSFERLAVGEIAQEPRWSASCVLVDLEGDGDLDVFVASYIDWTVQNHHRCDYDGVAGYCGPGTYAATNDLIYENLGDGRFREIHREAGIDYQSKGLVVCAADFNHDRIPEIYIGSDLTRNAFYQKNPGEFRYTNVAEDVGLAASKNGLAEATMGFAVRDFDSNGHIDLFLTHYYKNKNTLYLNQDKLYFKDASYESRIKALSFDFIGFGTIPIDYDNDSDFDLFISNGHVLGENVSPFRLTPQIINNASCRFFDISSQAGGYFQKTFAGRGVAQCDFDNDGDVDIAVGHLDAPLAILLNETETDNRYIQIQLLDVLRNDLTGTEVVIQVDDQEITLPVVKGESYLSSGDQRLHIGVGQAKSVEVTVKWRNGMDSKFGRLETGATWLLKSNDESVKLESGSWKKR